MKRLGAILGPLILLAGILAMWNWIEQGEEGRWRFLLGCQCLCLIAAASVVIPYGRRFGATPIASGK